MYVAFVIIIELLSYNNCSMIVCILLVQLLPMLIYVYTFDSVLQFIPTLLKGHANWWSSLCGIPVG